jgi:hypothetical protein
MVVGRMKLIEQAAIPKCPVMHGLLVALVAMACSPPEAMPCKYANSPAPEQYTGTFQLTVDGTMHTGTLEATVATDMLTDGGPVFPMDLPDQYDCGAPAMGTMTFDDGQTVPLAGGMDVTVSYRGGTSVRSVQFGALSFAGGGYYLEDSGSGPGHGGDIFNDKSHGVGTWEIH